MPNQLDCGFSLKDDIESIRTDPAFHDVIVTCSDGVEIGACSTILASRSPFFKAKFYGNMQESTSHKIVLHQIKSATFHTILRFIHNEDITSASISAAVDVYHAAKFLLLPKLMKLVVGRVNDNYNLVVPTSLLNQAVLVIPWCENTKDLYEALFKPFFYWLDIGGLNGFSEDALKLFLTKSAEFNISEYGLLLCVIEWAWARSRTTKLAARSHAIFDVIKLMPAISSPKILLKNRPSHKLLLKMMQYVDLTLICPYRLKSLTEAVDVLQETWAQYLKLYPNACKSTKCSAGHPYRLYRSPERRLQWDSLTLAKGLVLSEEDSVVEFPVTPQDTVVSVRASTSCMVGSDGLCEWDIVVESTALHFNNNIVALGFVSESFDMFVGTSVISEWGWQSYTTGTTYSNGKGVYFNYSPQIQQGNVVTFHLDMNKRICRISINGVDYGAAWTNLPSNANFYPAASLYPNAKYRIQPHVRFWCE